MSRLISHCPYRAVFARQAHFFHQAMQQQVCPITVADWLVALRGIEQTVLHEQLPPLTPKEHAIVGLLSQSYPFKHIAVELHLSQSTVRHHWQRIREKLGCRSTASGLVCVGRYHNAWSEGGQ